MAAINAGRFTGDEADRRSEFTGSHFNNPNLTARQRAIAHLSRDFYAECLAIAAHQLLTASITLRDGNEEAAEASIEAARAHLDEGAFQFHDWRGVL
jgi:hypothetical protein